MKNKSQLLLLGVFALSMSFQSCSGDEENSEQANELNEIVEVVNISPEDSLRNLLPEEASNYINDFEDLFTDEQEQLLTEKIDVHELATTNEIGIVTVSDFHPYENIDDYSLELFNKWGIGKKDKDNGVLIVVSNENHIVRISTGTGIEEILTDSMTTVINDDIMIPFFIGEDYYGGVDAGIDAVIDIIK